MSSAFTVYPSQLLDNSRSRINEPNHVLSHESQAHQGPPATPVDGRNSHHHHHHLSPYASGHTRSNSASPTLQHANTPDGSASTLSIQYQSSDFSDVDDDPFFGVDFGNPGGGTPSFLDESSLGFVSFNDAALPAQSYSTPPQAARNTHGYGYHPMSPEQTPSLHTSPQSGTRPSVSAFANTLPPAPAIAPQQLTKASRPRPAAITCQPAPDLTPVTSGTSGSGESSEDGLAPAPAAMPAQSPRVTVSMWGRDVDKHAEDASSVFPGLSDAYVNVRAGMSADDSSLPFPRSYDNEVAPTRDAQGSWLPNQATGQRGLDPTSRPSIETPSANDLAMRRRVQERNQDITDWLSQPMNQPAAQVRPDADDTVHGAAKRVIPEAEGVSDQEIALGSETVNTMKPGRTYYTEGGGELRDEDIRIMRENTNWSDAPMMFPISSVDSMRYQPQTSNAAIARFERQCHDNESIVSKAATWGTRRRSLPSLIDIDGITSGNFLKKLSISRGEPTPRRPSILGGLRTLVRKPSHGLLKRSRTSQDDDSFMEPEHQEEKREGQFNLAPPSRTMSWGKKQPVPSINTALISMGGSAASIGATHARSGSISTTPPITSPKSPFSLLKVENTLRRPRSKSDLPKTSGAEGSHSNLVGMWKKSGGPPVAQLAKTTTVDLDDDDDDEDEGFDESDMKLEATKLIEDIQPNFEGFKQHILKLNPSLATDNTYLVDRIAHQQIVRYKSLLNAKVKHMNYLQHRNCPCGTHCIGLGGSATILDSKGDPRSADPLSARYDGSDDDITPLEGAIAPESFPQDIPMPPTQTLPAEFECQLCFQAKKFNKPSDWTKHVHEDVQPFTCTWDRCRDPKIFKRKADWVRHENEGHRHLEWWKCDVDDCSHVCYRRDNFLQHLVREHKFPEPKVKTKAAIKKIGGNDLTWQKVEQCHFEHQGSPQSEPCRFCGKTLPTWKKLTVHLAKHMEQISLPILRLVARKQLDADTIISPVQDPPPRNFAPLNPSPIKHEAPFNMPMVTQAPTLNAPLNPLAYHSHQPNHLGQYPVMPQMPFGTNTGFYGAPFDGGLQHGMQSLDATAIAHTQLNTGYQAAFHHNQTTPVSNGGGYMLPAQTGAYMPAVEPFPTLSIDALGLQNTTGTLGYDMMDPSSAVTGIDSQHRYTPQGSVSPYSHSPNQNDGFAGHQGQNTGFYSQ